ncbi:MAG TPA: cohesin domain-containing protein [Thermoanaerobaculia bacterium]|nr:cohesin domain-containing protein [Thermoanaerobaculia bacterium]
MRRLRPGLATVVAGLSAAVLLALPGCGGGGGGRGPTQPPPPTTSLTFSAGTAGADSVALARTGATGGNILELALEARQVSNLYGVAFDLGYPASVLAYEGATPGDFLSSDGFQVSLQVAEESGNLIVGITRLGAVPAASGSGTLAILRFRAIGSGNGPLSFSRTDAVDGQGRKLDLDFVGGTVQSTL